MDKIVCLIIYTYFQEDQQDSSTMENEATSSQSDQHETKDGPNKRETCEKSFKEHRNNAWMHKGKRHFKCDICKLSFKQASTFHKHKRICSSGKLHIRKFCAKSLATNISYQKRICTKDNSYKCDHCEKIYHKKSLLIGHMKRAHKDRHQASKTYLCLYCNELLDTREKLREHKNCHKKNQGTYSCLVCNENFTQKDYLLNHEWIHTVYKKFTCESCNKTFDNEYTYITHKKLVHKNAMQEKESSNNFVSLNESITDYYPIKANDQEAEIKVEIETETVEAIEEDPFVEEEIYVNCQMRRSRVTIPGREKRLANSAYAVMLRSDIN